MHTWAGRNGLPPWYAVTTCTPVTIFFPLEVRLCLLKNNKKHCTSNTNHINKSYIRKTYLLYLCIYISAWWLRINCQKWKHLTPSVDTYSSISPTASIESLAISLELLLAHSLIPRLHFSGPPEKNCSLSMHHETVLQDCELEDDQPGQPWC